MHIPGPRHSPSQHRLLRVRALLLAAGLREGGRCAEPCPLPMHRTVDLVLLAAGLLIRAPELVVLLVC